LNQSNKPVVALIAICATIWIIAAIHPLDRQAWVLENILLVVFVGALAVSYRRLQLFSASWVLLAAFVILHTIGAHYTYEKMPLGMRAKDFFHLSRNHCDRFAHGAFGFLLAFPIRELLLRFSGIRRGAWSFALPVAIILGVSGCFEIIESIVAEIVAPGKGVQWLGGQGDEWDAQNDMVSALVGSLLMMGVVAVVEWKRNGPLSPAGRDARTHASPARTGSEGKGVGSGEADAERNTLPYSNARDNGKYFLPIAVACYVALWIALAIHPLDRGDWLLENLLIFISVTVLAVTYRKFRFSSLSYALILIFLAFHTIGAHYTYAKVPAGFWMQDWLHLHRNHYDRVIHFSFGFLLLYPMRELLVRSAHARPQWGIWLSAAALTALSSFFEIIEAVIAQIVAPDLGAAYLGTQGDIWDAQKDMAAAFVGALITAIALMFAPAQSTIDHQ
jgi:putative membrane protein